MNPKAMIPLVAGLCIAGLAAKLGFDYVQKARASSAQTVQLWTVTDDVPRGVAVSEQNLRPLKFPLDCAPKNAVADSKKIVGRVPHTGLAAGVPILDSMLLAEGVKAGVYVPPGLRAVAVKVDESSGVDNHLEPACRVDVVGYFNIRVGGKQETVARTILENVEVAAVGQRLAPEAPDKDMKDGKKSSSASKDKMARAVTLLVKPEQVPILHLAEKRGDIKLSMRNNDDAEPRTKSDSTREAQVLGQDEPTNGKDGESKPGLLETLAGWFKQKDAPASQPVVEAPKTEPEPAPEPKFLWTMVIFNGNEQRTFGWKPGGQTRPVEISVDGPNIFQDGPQRKSKTKPADAPGGHTEPPAPEPEESSGDATDEPKELVG